MEREVIKMKKNKGFSLVMVFVLITVVVLVAAVGYVFMSRNSAGNGLLVDDTALVTPGKLTLATDPTYPPMELVDENGEATGFGIDVARAVAEELGLELEIRQLPWDELFEAVENGEVDGGVSSITITEERSETYAFSSPYFSSGQAILVETKNDSIVDPEDLLGLVVAANEDTTSSQQAKSFAGEEGSVIEYAGAVDDTLEALKQGEIDAIIIDYPVAIDISQNEPKIKVVGDPFTSEFYGIMMRKGNSQLVKSVDYALSNIRQSGTIENIMEKWIGR